MRVLFVMRNTGNARNFERVISELAERGHEVHLAFELTRRPTSLPARLAARYPTVTHGPARNREDGWMRLAEAVRSGIDYLRYLRPPYVDTPALEARSRNAAPKWLVALTRAPGGRRPAVLDALDRLLRAIDRRIPTDPAVGAWLREQRPDIVLVSPLVGGPHQTEFVRSAREEGIRTGLAVTSWDNLTNKGLIRDRPDHVYLWNEIQRTEAVELHGMERDRVHPVGAHSYDHWFEWASTMSGDEFRRLAGLPEGRPFVLWLCSSMFIAREEPAFVAKWIERLRSDERLRDVGILIRPHPSSGEKLWKESPLRELPGVTVFPAAGADPNNDDDRRDYFESMYHCSAVAGINSSSLIESSIVGRPVFTLEAPEFRDTQQGTIHFRYLRSENGGPLTVAPTFEEHLDHLAAAVSGDSASAGWNLPFVSHFVRPHGLDVPAAPIFADRLEEAVAAAPPPPHRYGRPGGAPALRALRLLALWPTPKQRRRLIRSARRRLPGILR